MTEDWTTKSQMAQHQMTKAQMTEDWMTSPNDITPNGPRSKCKRPNDLSLNGNCLNGLNLNTDKSRCRKSVAKSGYKLQSFKHPGDVVVVKWSSWSPSTLTTRVRILLLNLCFETNENKQKEAGGWPIKKVISTASMLHFYLISLKQQFVIE